MNRGIQPSSMCQALASRYARAKINLRYEVNNNYSCRVVKAAFSNNPDPFKDGFFLYDFKNRSFELIDGKGSCTIESLAAKAFERGNSCLLITDFLVADNIQMQRAFDRLLKIIGVKEIELQHVR